MTRSDVKTAITAKLDLLDDAQLEALLDVVDALEAPRPLGRALSAREMDLLRQAKADFAAGRSLSLEEGFAMIDARLAARRQSQ